MGDHRTRCRLHPGGTAEPRAAYAESIADPYGSQPDTGVPGMYRRCGDRRVREDLRGHGNRGDPLESWGQHYPAWHHARMEQQVQQASYGRLDDDARETLTREALRVLIEERSDLRFCCAPFSIASLRSYILLSHSFYAARIFRTQSMKSESYGPGFTNRFPKRTGRRSTLHATAPRVHKPP